MYIFLLLIDLNFLKVSKKPMVKLAEKQKNYEANSRNIKKFLIDQLKKDQLEMQKTKEVGNNRLFF